MKRKEISVVKQIFLEYTIVGLLFIVSSGASLVSLIIETRNLERLLDLISVIAVFCACCVLIYVRESHKQESDELAKFELYKAYFEASLVTDLIAICIVIFICIFQLIGTTAQNIKISIRVVISGMDAIIFGFMGVKKLATGISFNNQENSDDDEE